jgi:hypothetical protein
MKYYIFSLKLFLSIRNTMPKLILPAKEIFQFKGKFDIEHWRNKKLIYKDKFPNQIVNVGKGYILDTMFNNQTQITNTAWSMGLIDNAGFTAIAVTDIMATHAGWVENVAYSGGTRPAWGQGASSAQTTTNASPATFNITATGTLQGIFVVSNNTLSGVTGILWTEALFSSPIPVTNGDQIKCSYSVSC